MCFIDTGKNFLILSKSFASVNLLFQFTYINRYHVILQFRLQLPYLQIISVSDSPFYFLSDTVLSHADSSVSLNSVTAKR